MLIAQLLVTVFQPRRRGRAPDSCAESQGGELGGWTTSSKESPALYKLVCTVVEFAELCFKEGWFYVPIIFHLGKLWECSVGTVCKRMKINSFIFKNLLILRSTL